MRATVMHKAHDVTIENVPDAFIKQPKAISQPNPTLSATQYKQL